MQNSAPLLNAENEPVFAPQARTDDSLLKAIQSGLRLFNARLSEHALLQGMPPFPDTEIAQQHEWAVRALHQHAVRASWQRCEWQDLKSWLLPAVVRLNDGSYLLVCETGKQQCRVVIPETGSGVVTMESTTLAASFSGDALFFRPQGHLDRRTEDLVQVDKQHWFWHTVFGFKRYLFEAVGLSIVINVLALAMSIFTMTVYNRVLPNQTYVTLWTMAIGVSLALLFEVASRLGRAWIIERAGKKIDLLLGAKIFRHVMAAKMENKAQSDGAFGNVMQSFETVRDLVTSAVLTTIADLPFVVLFLLVIHMVAGPLVWCVAAILLTLAVVVLIMQYPLKKLAQQSMKVGSNRQGVVMEALNNLETLKALRAENSVAEKHDIASLELSGISMKSRFMSVMGSSLIQCIQQFGVVALLVWGTYLVGEGEISMGGIIATMTLMSRATQPVASLAALALRMQQARTSMSILNRVMNTPTERERDKVYVQLPQGCACDLHLVNATFRYKPDLPAAVDGLDLHVGPGEKVAILGRMGSGKSSLLRLLVGLYQPCAGEVKLCGVDIRQVDPAELRSRIALVNQEARLMFGTLRDNLLLGAPWASDAEMLETAKITGVDQIVAHHPMGYGMPVGERGETLSGGQKQAIALARALLTRPEILLLDEPTSGMDMGSERLIMQALEQAMVGHTVIIVTHRPAILKYVDRVIVMDEGIKVADGPRDEIVALLNSGQIPAAAVLRAAAKPSGVVSASA